MAALVANGLILGGVGLTSYGAWLYSPPLGFAVGGGLALALGGVLAVWGPR